MPFPRKEYQERLARIRAAMATDGIDVLFLTAPESLYYVSGFQCEWYQAQSGRAFPPDWVGGFIYDLAHARDGDVFRPMTVVNHECNFFGPRSTGLSATIDTIFFHRERAALASRFPRELEALCL